MGRFYCNGKKGYCEKVCGTQEECNMADCTSCEFVNGSGGEYKDFTTNYDRIKSMSVEEMANFIEDVAKIAKNTRCTMGIEERKEWLHQEASDNNND